MTANTTGFWEQPEQVERFAARQADKRLVELIGSYRNPGKTCILDLGCAAGRNAVLLAEQGFDFYAMDASQAMVEKTRRRVGSILNSSEAQKRILFGRMDDLQAFQTNSFHLVIALGLYQNATSQKEFEAALVETARVLMPNGQLLVASFSPRCSPNGTVLRKSPAEDHVYEGFAAGPMFLVEAEEMDSAMARFGLAPIVPTETVVVRTDPGQRVTVNGHYRNVGMS